ncbi:MAG: DNA-processing protein DprA [Oscillospiraceae bacterium]|nr:DNA-processing protein DprA [Oscillospiraceae bacterium]
MINTEKWIWLSLAMTGGTPRMKRVLMHFGSAEAIYAADEETIRAACLSISGREVEALSDKNLAPAEKIVSECIKKNIRIAPYGSKEYPERLWQIDNPPVVLYLKGEPLCADAEAAVAIVGTRKASAAGKTAAEKIAGEICECGGVVVTGLATGLDTYAAEGALRAGGKVIGVLGCGADICYPRENKRLFAAVEQSGTIVSDYPPGTEPSRFNFPKRNRIISGISLGTVVVEAPKRSGALITASLALEQNRDVFAVPGGIFEMAAEGSNELIREGAIAVMSGYDVMSEYEANYGIAASVRRKEREKSKKEQAEKNAKNNADAMCEGMREKVFSFPNGYLEKFSPQERAILEAIGENELRADDISSQSGVGMQRLLSLLTLLEIRGSIKQLPGGRYKNIFVK